MPDKMKEKRILPPIRENQGAIVQAEQSVESSTSQITSNTDAVDVPRILREKGAYPPLVKAIEAANSSRAQGANRLNEQLNLDLDDKK